MRAHSHVGGGCWHGAAPCMAGGGSRRRLMRCQCQGDASPPPPPQPPKQPSDKPKSSEALAERIKRLKEANATYRQAVQSLSKAQHARAQQYIDASGKGSGAANDASSSGSPPTDAAAAPAPAAPAAVTVATITVEVAPPSARAPTPTPTPAPAPASAPAAPTAAPAAPVPAAAPAAAPASASPPASPPLAVASTSGRVTISSSSSELGAFTLTVDGKPPGAGQLMDVVFVSAEVAPWSKTGGLGDVMGALPVALAARGHRVMVVSPRYLNDDTWSKYASMEKVGSKEVQIAHKQHKVNYFHVHERGVDWVFADHDVYNRPGSPYADPAGVPFGDNVFRFHLLCMAALEAPLVLPIGSCRRGVAPGAEGNMPYGQHITFMANDWHTALLPVLLRERYHCHDVYKDATTMMSIHNLSHQGSFKADAFNQLGLDGKSFSLFEWQNPEDPRRKRTVNFFKAGIMASDALITVSQTYAREIITQPQEARADLFLAKRSEVLRGIVNGVDATDWDPETDTHLARTYGPAEVTAGKAANKRLLLRKLRMPAHEGDPPLVVFIGRLDYQKGPDLMLEALPFLANLDCRVIMLGSGAADYEASFRQAEEEYGWCTRVHIGFDVPLAHQILAAADILLMPSRFEPCGLNQLYAMRYGTIPVAHATGGLSDTIEDYNPFSTAPEGEGTGWTFSPASVDAAVDAVSAAVKVLREQPKRWRAMQLRGMSRDTGWGKAAAQYEKAMLAVRDGTLVPAKAKA